MKAIDTNVIIRVITRDEPIQTAVAMRIIASDVFVPLTVLLETGWVLARSYRQDRPAIADALCALLDLPTVHVTDEPGLRRAIGLFRSGADLADAMHLVAAGSSEAFITFDVALARRTDASLPIELAS